MTFAQITTWTTDGLKWLAKPAAGAAILAVVAVLIIICSAALRGPVTSTLVLADQPVGEGVLYSLPKSQITVSTTLHIKRCRLIGKEVVLDTTQDISVTAAMVPDPVYRYRLEAASLQHPILTDAWSFGLTADGFLSGVSYSPTSLKADAEVIKATIDGLVAAVQPGAVADASDPKKEEEACKGLPTITTPQPAGTGSLSVPADGQAASQPVSPEVTLTTEQVVGDALDPVVLEPGAQFTTGYSDGARGALAKLKLEVFFDRPGAATPATAIATARGIVYRAPAYLNANICRETCLNSTQGFAKSQVIYTRRLRYLGAGTEGVLPLDRGWFGERKASIALSTDGILSSVALNREPVPAPGANKGN